MICPHCGEPLQELDVSFDFATRTVTSGGKTCTLGRVQLTIFECLIDSYPHGVTAAQIAADVYTDESADDKAPNTIRTHLRNMRARLAESSMPWEITMLSDGTGGVARYALTAVNGNWGQPAQKSAA